MKTVRNKISLDDTELWIELNEFIEPAVKYQVFHVLDLDLDDRISQVFRAIDWTLDDEISKE